MRPKCRVVNSDEIQHFLIEVENQDSKKFMCKECNYSSTNKNNVQRHIFLKHLHFQTEDNKIFLCKECNYSSKYETNLRRHIKNKHSENGHIPVTCEICGRLFKHNYSLTCHMQQNHWAPKGYTKCENCRENVPSAEFPSHSCQEYVCHFCDKVFKTFQYLKSVTDWVWTQIFKLDIYGL